MSLRDGCLTEKEQMLWREEALYTEVIERLDFSREQEDGEVESLLDEILCQRGRQLGLTASQRENLRTKLFNRLRRFDVLQELLEDGTVTEIMVNGPDNIFVERAGVLYRCDRHFASRERLEDVIQQMVSKVNRVVNESSPIVDARLEDGSRVNVVLPPVSIDGPILTIRKFSRQVWTLEQMAQMGMLTVEAAAFLGYAVEAGANIFVSGGTGTGKTTFLNALACAIPKEERIVVIEDSAELKIGLPNLVRLEVRNANGEGTEKITIRELIRTSLRMRPERIVVGEVRGEEALDMLQAMNTGHNGSLSSGHANSPADMVSRLETMVLMGAELPLTAIRAQISSALNFIVHLSRNRKGERRVVSIVEVGEYDRNKDEIRLSPIFAFSDEKNQLEKVGDSSFIGERCSAFAGEPG